MTRVRKQYFTWKICNVTSPKKRDFIWLLATATIVIYFVYRSQEIDVQLRGRFEKISMVSLLLK